MAAPSSTQWGATMGNGNNQGCIGINVSKSQTELNVTVTIDIYYWARYAVNDSGNSFSYGWGKSANTSIGSKNIRVTGNSGSGWSTSNQVFIGSYSTTYSRGGSDTTQYASASFSGIDYGGGSGSVTVSFTIPSKTVYTITYNANGGSGAPSPQAKLYGVNLTLSSIRPTRSGYNFLGWGTSAYDTTVDYAPRSTYSGNSNITLYAIWGANAYTVSYDANGGSGAPGSQTKTHGVALTLSSTRPYRTNYNFVGWGASPGSTTVLYSPGAQYTNNVSITLYAIWSVSYIKPRITNYSLQRTDSYGNYTEDGTYCRVKFDWECDISSPTIHIYSKLSGTTNLTYETTIYGSGYRGNVNTIIGGSFYTTNSYDILVRVTDSGGFEEYTKSLGTKKRAMEVRADRDGVSFGGSANETGLVSHWDLKLKTGKIVTPNGLTLDGKLTLNSNSLNSPSNLKINNHDIPSAQYTNGYWGLGSPDGNTGSYIRTPVGGLLPYQSGGQGSIGTSQWAFASGYFNNIYRNGKEIGTPKVLWSGGAYVQGSESITLSESISSQTIGVVLVFSEYNTSGGYANDANYADFFISKEDIRRHGNYGHIFSTLAPWGSHMCKYLYIYDSKMIGHDFNSQNWTNGGVVIKNSYFVLREVIGV